MLPSISSPSPPPPPPIPPPSTKPIINYQNILAATTSSSSSSPTNNNNKTNKNNSLLNLTTPPNTTDLINKIPSNIFQTPLQDFDAPTAALGDLPLDTNRQELDEELISRREMIDLQRDAVIDALGEEVRVKGPELIAGMHQIQELDLDVTRTYLATRAARRRLNSARENYYEASLRVSELADLRTSTTNVYSLVQILVEANQKYRLAKDEHLPVHQRCDITLETLNWLKTCLRDPSKNGLLALQQIQSSLQEQIPQLIQEVNQEFSVLMCRYPLDKEEFEILSTCLSKLEPDIPLQTKLIITTKNIVESLFSYSVVNTHDIPIVLLSSSTTSNSNNPILGDDVVNSNRTNNNNIQQQQPFTAQMEHTMFRLIVDCLSAYIAAEELLHSKNQDVTPNGTTITTATTLPSTEKLQHRREIWSVVEQRCIAHLKRPEARTLTLDGFRQLVSNCEILVVIGRGFCFGEAKATLQLSGAIKQRTNAFALQFQAEGFEAMRGFLSRETWYKFASKSGATAESVLSRLEKKVIPLPPGGNGTPEGGGIRILSWREKDPNPFFLLVGSSSLSNHNSNNLNHPTNNNNNDDQNHTSSVTTSNTSSSTTTTVLTATTASGLPRQITRTAELIKKLPSSAGVAYQGLQRAFDVYLVTIWSLFVHDRYGGTGNTYRQWIRSQPAHTYVSSCREGLREWFSSSSTTTTTTTTTSSSIQPTAQTTTTTTMNGIVDNNNTIGMVSPSMTFNIQSKWLHALVASESLDFVQILAEISVTSLDETLPTVEGSKLTSRTREMMACIPDLKQQLYRAAICDLIDFNHIESSILDEEMIEWESDEIELLRKGNPYVSDALHMANQMWITLMKNASFDDSNNTTQSNNNNNGGAATIQDSSYPLSIVPVVFDEACCMLFNTLVDAWSQILECSLQGRAAMALDLATLSAGLEEICGVSGGTHNNNNPNNRPKYKTRADDFVKAYYLDREEDLLNWIKSKRQDFSVKHFLAILQAGMFGQSNLGKRRLKEVRMEIERIMMMPITT
jgi:hypothetical protein